MAKTSRLYPSPFNGPVECGIRALVLLKTAHPASCDLARLVVYDYLLVHSGDVSSDILMALGIKRRSPESLHPPTPNRSGELLVRRKMMLNGLDLLMRRGLVVPRFGIEGITYAATELAAAFVALLESEYTRDLVSRAEWVVPAFGSMSDEELSSFTVSHLRDWGGEFLNESLLRSREP